MFLETGHRFLSVNPFNTHELINCSRGIKGGVETLDRVTVDVAGIGINVSRALLRDRLATKRVPEAGRLNIADYAILIRYFHGFTANMAINFIVISETFLTVLITKLFLSLSASNVFY